MTAEIHPAGIVTVWVALMGYSITLTLLASGRWKATRFVWLASALTFLVHALIAMGSAYGWSHRTAIDATAADTALLTGIESGAGLWLNYLFTLIWLSDATYWVGTGDESYRNRARWLQGLVHGFLGFMVVNGSIVFVSGPKRLFGLFLILLPLAGLLKFRTSRSEKVIDS